MDLHTWLDVPSNKGRAAWLAEQFGIERAAVSFWRSTGVPLDRMKAIEALTDGAVTVAEMVEHKMSRSKKPSAASQEAA